MMKSFGNFLFVVIFNKITSQANIQPWPIRVERVGSCCDVIFKAERGTSSATGLLDHCVESNTDHDLHSDVAILNFGVPGNGPFAVPDIQDFAVYQRAIIASYAETNQYLFRSITPDSSNWHNCRMKMNDTISLEQSFGTTDYRWFKVKFLMDAMDTACGWAKDSKFLVWIDADAIVLDFGLRIEQIASSYPLADLIASADIRMGLINTGFLILRNTPWMRSFLHDWWYSVDKTTVCDQDAFDQLYARYSNREEKEQQYAPLHADSIQRKVKVLPMDALNSHPPAMLHQQDSNRVLHLMGEATSLRTAVFRKGLQNICAARSGGVLPAQLGLRRDVLIRYALVVYKEQVQTLQLAANSSADSNDRSLNNIGPSQQQNSNISSTSSRTYNESSLEVAYLGPVDALMRAAHHYCDLLHHMQRSSPISGGEHQLEAQRLRHSILQLIVGRVDNIRRDLSSIDREAAVAVSQLHQTAEVPASPTASSSAEVLTLQSDLTIASMRKAALVSVMLQLLKKAAEAGNDLFGASDAVQDKLNAGQLVFDILEDIISLVDESSRVVPMHMKALMHQNLGLLHYDISMSFAEGDGGDGAPSHPLSSSSATTITTTISALDFSKAHLHQSYDHLKSSVSLFDEYLQNSTESSTLMEASYSIQLWAGVACTMKRYRDGTKLWDRAISHAYHSLQGINQGVRYDNLAAVLYNAAQCYKDSKQLQRASELLRDAMSVIASSISSSGGSPTQTTLRATIQSFSDELQQPRSSRDRRGEREEGREREAASVGDPRVGSDEVTVGSMRPVDTPSGRVYIPINKASSDGTSQAASSDSDDQLWEECSQEEQARGDCESFYVYEDEDDEGEGHESKGDDLVQALQVDERPPEALIDADDPLAGLDTDGMTDEDIAELAEVRLRHAEHTARLLTNSLGTHQTPSIVDSISSPSIVDRLNAIERTLSQLLLEVKALKGLVDPSSLS